MSTEPVRPGELVTVKTAFGNRVLKRAVTGVIAGESFNVVRVCSEAEWEESIHQDRQPHSSPWPAEDVAQAATL